MTILTCNAGSSSLKCSLFEEVGESLIAEGQIDWGREMRFAPAGSAERVEDISQAKPDAVLGEFIATFQGVHPSAITAVAHRVVHGGEEFVGAVRITGKVKDAIRALASLAPLHNRENVRLIELLETLLPAVPHVASFDTAFHHTIPELARTYPVPSHWRSEWGIRRFGFHGLSHSYCSSRACELLDAEKSRVIVLHLGNGASASAISAGKCVATSMGFTPLEGMMMGTRSGSIDPGIILHLLKEKKLSLEAIDRQLHSESGLQGVSGISSDMRDVLAAQNTSAAARLAIEMYVARVAECIAAMSTHLGGVDAIVFTAGIGEHVGEIRKRVAAKIVHLGFELDTEANSHCIPDCDIAAKRSIGRILVLHTREDITMVRELRHCLQRAS